MSKQHSIRWRRSDYAKLSHAIRKANQKTFGLEVKRPDLAGHIPEQMDYQTIKAGIKTRQDLNNFLNKWKRYLEDGSEELVKSERGAVASKWEVREFNIAQRAENTRRANQRKKLGEKEVTIGGKGTGVKRAEMGKIKEVANNPSKKKFKNMSQKEWDKAFELFEKKMTSTYNNEQKQNMLRNYMKGLIREGYNDELLDLMNTIPLDKFVEVVNTDEKATFDFIYDPIELKSKQEQLSELWFNHSAGENVNNININNIVEEVDNEISI